MEKYFVKFVGTLHKKLTNIITVFAIFKTLMQPFGIECGVGGVYDVTKVPRVLVFIVQSLTVYIIQLILDYNKREFKPYLFFVHFHH